MDIGDWVFLGMIAVSGIASLSKATKKKKSEQTSQQPIVTDAGKSDADDWIKNVLRETTKGFMESDDEFIPKNEPKPSVVRRETTDPQLNMESPKSKSQVAEKYPNAELYRRSNQTLEVAARSRIGLEDTSVMEGNVKHTGLHVSNNLSIANLEYDQSLLNPVDDFKDLDEVRKAVLYGEIMRPKF